MLCLVNEVKEQMQGALLDVLYKRDESGNMSVENLLEEDADYTRQKKRCQEFLHLVRTASLPWLATISLRAACLPPCLLARLPACFPPAPLPPPPPACLPACLSVSVRLSLTGRLPLVCVCSSRMQLVSCARCRISGVEICSDTSALAHSHPRGLSKPWWFRSAR